MQILIGFNAAEPEDYYDSKTKLSIISLSYISIDEIADSQRASNYISFIDMQLACFIRLVLLKFR